MQVTEIYNRAREAEKRGRHAEALRLYKVVLRHDLNFRPALMAVGVLYSRIGSLEIARGFFERAYKLKKDETVCFNLGSLFYKLEHFVESRDYLEQCLQFDRRMLRAHILLAYLYQREKRWDKAALSFRNALAQERHNRIATLGYVIVLIEQGRHETALQFLEDYCRAKPADQTAQSLKAGLFLQLGRLEESHTEYKKLVDQSERFTAFTKHLEAARRETGQEYMRLFQDLDIKIGERTRRLQKRLSAKTAAGSVATLSGAKAKKGGSAVTSGDSSAEGEQPAEQLHSELRDMIDISLLHLFNGDREKALKYLFQARKHKNSTLET